MKIPNYIRSKMHLCASHARQAAKYEFEVANWLGEHGIDVEFISTGDGTSFEELMYGNDVTDELCQRIEKLEIEQDTSGKQKAHWQWFEEELGNPFDGYERDWGWECSNCGYVLPDDYDDPDIEPKFRYCMNCGAKMFSEVPR